MSKKRLGAGVSVLLVWGVLCSRAEALVPSPDAYSQQIYRWFEAEIWRTGGPRPGRVLDFYEGIVAGGKVEAVLAATRHIFELLDNRWLDGSGMWRFVPLLANVDRRGTTQENNDISEMFRERLVLATMSDGERQQLYRRALKEGSVWYDVGRGARTSLGWQNAAIAALREHLDELVPDIEAALSGHRSQIDKAPLLPSIEGVLLPLAQARSTGNWVSAYMELIRQAVTSQTDRTEMNPSSIRNCVVREALLELVHKNQQGVVGQLIGLYEEPHENAVPMADGTREGVQTPMTSPPRPRTGPAAEWLARAAKALGKPVPQERSETSSAPSEGEAAERVLIRDGYLKRPAVQDPGLRK